MTHSRKAPRQQRDKRAYAIADNKLALNAGWDESLLAEELQWKVRRQLAPSSPRYAGYEVGYGKPPARHQFQKAVRQRPKGTTNKLPALNEERRLRIPTELASSTFSRRKVEEEAPLPAPKH